MNSFELLKNEIHILSELDFRDATVKLKDYIDRMNKKVFLNIVEQIGTIPESINHDSSEEKLYSKASDIVLARCFRELGLAAKALDERADSADILAESTCGYAYSLVADSKCFRLSRTAKNQKDFKVSNLSDWRGVENEYAVLVAPFFQYPKVKSQVYSKALENNVCLISWEHISILLNNNIRESTSFSLESIWNSSKMIARDKSLSFSNAKKCFLPKINAIISKKIGISLDEFNDELSKYKSILKERGNNEIIYWNSVKKEIQSYSKEKAIEELIKSKKLNEKIKFINDYINKL